MTAVSDHSGRDPHSASAMNVAQEADRANWIRPPDVPHDALVSASKRAAVRVQADLEERCVNVLFEDPQAAKLRVRADPDAVTDARKSQMGDARGSEAGWVHRRTSDRDRRLLFAVAIRPGGHPMAVAGTSTEHPIAALTVSTGRIRDGP